MTEPRASIPPAVQALRNLSTGPTRDDLITWLLRYRSVSATGPLPDEPRWLRAVPVDGPPPDLGPTEDELVRMLTSGSMSGRLRQTPSFDEVSQPGLVRSMSWVVQALNAAAFASPPPRGSGPRVEVVTGPRAGQQGEVILGAPMFDRDDLVCVLYDREVVPGTNVVGVHKRDDLRWLNQDEEPS